MVDVRVDGVRQRCTFPKETPPDILKNVERRLYLKAKEPLKGKAKKLARETALPDNVLVISEVSLDIEAAAQKLYLRTRYRATHRKIKFDLSLHDVQQLMLRSAGYCEVTGVRLIPGLAEGVKRNPYAPSIDRVNPKLGYTFSNTRVVAVATNVALNEFGEAVFAHLAQSFVERTKPRHIA